MGKVRGKEMREIYVVKSGRLWLAASVFGGPAWSARKLGRIEFRSRSDALDYLRDFVIPDNVRVLSEIAYQ